MNPDQNLKAELTDYIKSIDPHPLIRETLLDPSFIVKPSEVYLSYPYLFASAFNIEDERTLRKLSMSGFFTFKYILVLDDLIDKPEGSNPDYNLILASECLEQAVRLLMSLFPYKDNFWEYWKVRKKEFIDAQLKQKEISTFNSVRQFYELADNKSAFGKLCIDALFVLSGQQDRHIYNTLLESHRYAYIASQYLDDIRDFVADWKQGLFNIAVFETSAALRSNSIEFDEQDIERAYKYLYINGIADKLMLEAGHFLKLASDSCSGLGLEHWNQLLESKKKSLHFTRERTRDYIYSVNNKTYVRPASDLKKAGYIKSFNPDDIRKACQAAGHFIKSCQQNDGCWADLNIDGQYANVLSTAMVLKFSENLINKPFISDGLSFLNARCHGLWSINNVWINDLHTSAWAISALSSYDINLPGNMDYIVGLQNADGGFGAFPDPDKLISFLKSENVKGWTSSHHCISVMIAGLLSKGNYRESESFDRLISFLKQGMAERSLHTYWYTSDILICSLICSYSKLSELLLDINGLKNMLTYFFDKQNNDGSFHDEYAAASPFYTALAANALLELGKATDSIPNALYRSLLFLLNQQLEDGSWPSTAFLRIPQPSDTDPWHSSAWKKMSKGFHVRIEEETRVISSSACLMVLNNYLNSI